MSHAPILSYIEIACPYSDAERRMHDVVAHQWNAIDA